MDLYEYNIDILNQRIQRISLLVTLREPLATTCSWVGQFSFGADKNALLSHLIISYQSVDAAARLANIEGIPVSAFLYESLHDNDIDHVMLKLFSHLSLPYEPGSLENWNMLPSMNSPESHIIFPFQSEKYESTQGHRYHEKVESSDSFRYYQKDPTTIDQTVTIEDVVRLQRSRIFSLYDEYRLACINCYDIAIEPPKELDTYLERQQTLRREEGNRPFFVSKSKEA